MLLFLLASSICISLVNALPPCQTCIKLGYEWCADNNQCNVKGCQTAIRNNLNCPTAPQAAYAYTDDFGRYVASPLITAVYTDNPTKCFQNQIPTTSLYQKISVPCSQIGPNETCFAYTAFDSTKNAVIVTFRGTQGQIQLDEEIESFFEKKEPFFDSGHVFKYFYDAFYLMWNQGLERSVRNLKQNYPNYDIWVFGHSLGGAMASVCASHILKTNLYSPDHLRLLTFGQPRTGDQDFARWHDATFLYSYRIVHHQDIVPHVPPRGGPDMVWHHRYEIWYNNNMTETDNYVQCAEDDGLYCSNTQISSSGIDHIVYFNKNMNQWSATNCAN